MQLHMNQAQCPSGCPRPLYVSHMVPFSMATRFVAARASIVEHPNLIGRIEQSLRDNSDVSSLQESVLTAAHGAQSRVEAQLQEASSSAQQFREAIAIPELPHLPEFPTSLPSLPELPTWDAASSWGLELPSSLPSLPSLPDWSLPAWELPRLEVMPHTPFYKASERYSKEASNCNPHLLIHT